MARAVIQNEERPQEMRFVDSESSRMRDMEGRDDSAEQVIQNDIMSDQIVEPDAIVDSNDDIYINMKKSKKFIKFKDFIIKLPNSPGLG